MTYETKIGIEIAGIRRSIPLEIKYRVEAIKGVSGDGMRRELFYVAASRGRETLQIITSDKELLRESVGLSSARQSASELEPKKRPGLHQGMNRGLAMARILARRTMQFIKHLREPFAQKRELSYQPVMETSHDWGLE